MTQVYTVKRPRPKNTISTILLNNIDAAFDKRDAPTLMSVCKDNIIKFANSPAQASNVATAVRFPLGEINRSSIGLHVYLSSNGEDQIHSHGQNIDTFVFRGTFQDEIFEFVPHIDGAYVTYKISRKFTDKDCIVSFRRDEMCLVSNSYRRSVKEGDIGSLSSEIIHRVHAREGVITLYRFWGPFLDSNTYLPKTSPLSLRHEQTIAEKERLIATSNSILKHSF